MALAGSRSSGPNAATVAGLAKLLMWYPIGASHDQDCATFDLRPNTIAAPFPERKKLGALWDAGTADQFSAAERRVRALGRELAAVKLESTPYDFAAAFRTLADAQSQALLVLSGPTFAFHQTTRT